MTASRPISADDLVRWLEGSLSEPIAQAVDALVASRNEDALKSLSWLRRLVTKARVRDDDRPPAHLHQRLLNLFDASHLNRAVDHLLDAELIGLIFDSDRDMSLVGTRGADVSPQVRRLAYAGVDADVVLHIEGDKAGLLTIHGHVPPRMPGAAESVVASVLQPRTGPQSEPGTPNGQFVLHNVEAEATELRVSNAELHVRVHLPSRSAGHERSQSHRDRGQRGPRHGGRRA